MRPLAATALAFVFLVLASGCGEDGGEQPADERDPDTAEVEATLDRVVEAPDLRAFCEIQSRRQLTESFGRGDPMERCLQNAERRREAALATYEVDAVARGCARVLVADGRGREALLYMRDIDGRWLVHDIEDPSTPTEGTDPVCGGMRLWQESGSTGD
jgi:hypothetical protein